MKNITRRIWSRHFHVIVVSTYRTRGTVLKLLEYLPNIYMHGTSSNNILLQISHYNIDIFNNIIIYLFLLLLIGLINLLNK